MLGVMVKTNVSSINANRRLNNATLSLDTTYERLSSGLRINSAKDDSAGLLMTSRMTAQINGLYQGNRNANDGIALAQTAEGALDEVTSMLQSMRTKAIQSANGTNSQADREALQKDVANFSNEITRISEKTTFNGMQILSGKDGDNTMLVNGKLQFQVGSNANDLEEVDLSKGFSMNAIIKDGLSSYDGQVIVQAATAAAFTNNPGLIIDVETGKPTTDTAPVDGKVYRLDDGNANTTYFVSVDTMQTMRSGSNATVVAGSAIGGGTIAADTAAEGDTITLNKDGFLDLINGVNYDDGAGNSASYGVVNSLVKDVFGFALSQPQPSDLTAVATGSTSYTGDMSVDISTYESAQKAIANIDKYIAYIDNARGDLGAIQNRMESAVRNQSNVMENTMDARSRIRDADFAQETSNLVSQNIIQQAAGSMLMQANQRPQIALSLLNQ